MINRATIIIAFVCSRCFHLTLPAGVAVLALPLALEHFANRARRVRREIFLLGTGINIDGARQWRRVNVAGVAEGRCAG